MKTFKHINVTSLAEASQLLKNNARSRAIAGGTDLLGALKDDIHPDYPELLVNLKTIEGLDYIHERDGQVYIGAMTKLKTIADHSLIHEKYSALSEAAATVANPQIRNMATLGGNLCQETRCWYYRHPGNHFHCLRKGGSICGALIGENRYHSIVGAMRMQNTPCSAHCPAGTDIPEYLESIRAGDLDQAATILLKSNPFPAITGRVCPHYCQEGCNRQDFDQAVSIREVERFLGDYILDNKERFFQQPEKESGKIIAVIGSGPGGLGAAYFLRRAGYRVTVFERLEKPGGMLTYTIPSYRLPPEIVERSIEALEGMGIEFQCGVAVGENKTYQELQESFDGIFLATGAWKQPRIGFEGEERALHALEFLKDIQEGLRQAPGENVVVIGGGNVAMDVAISASRLGAENVTVICLEQPEEMPALEAELQQALDEGIEIVNGWGPKRVELRGGKVAGIEFVRCVSVFDVDGRFAPQYDEKQTKSVEADAIILAVGQQVESEILPGEIVKNGRVRGELKTGRTGVTKFYAGGDLIKVANAIDAIAAGKNAAASIHYDLTGETLRQRGEEAFHTFMPVTMELVEAAKRPARDLNLIQIDQEDTSTLPQALFEREAQRCLNCGCVAVTPSDTATALIALDATIVTTEREIPAGQFFACLEESSTVLEQGELVKEIRLPELEVGTRSTYTKYRQRKSIDFPIVSAAVRLTISGDKIQDSRVVLGAVAPVPLRARSCEAFLDGKTSGEVRGPDSDGKNNSRLPYSEAANLAVDGTMGLQENQYKIQLTRAYVRRALMACLTM